MNPNLPPAVWLVLWLAATTFVCTLVAWLAYQAGWDHCERDRHPARHAAGDPPPAALPVAGQLSLFPGDDEDWSFFGGAQVEPRPGRDEYLLLVQQAVDRVSAESAACETMEEFIVRQARETDDVISSLERETARLTRMMQNGSWP
jgi:hypothetical protein